MHIVSLEGNIGAGKSTLLARLKTQLPDGWVCLEEPVHVWETFRDTQGTTMLEKFYQQPEKYAFAFQMMAYTTRRKALEDALAENPVGILCERSLAADQEIFAKMLRDDGMLESVLYDIYAFEAQRCGAGLDAIVYLDVPVDTCLDRIAQRGRQGEGGVGRDYIEKCETYYKNWLATTLIPTFHVKGDDDVEEMVLSICREL